MSFTRTESRGSRRTFPLPPHELPALDALFNGSLWDRWSSDRKVAPLEDLRSAVRYVRLKPATSCRMFVFAGGAVAPGRIPRGFLLHLYPDGDRARTAFEKIASRPVLIDDGEGYRPFLSETHAAVVVPFPNDVEVPGLRHVYRPHRLQRSLIKALAGYSERDWAFSKDGMRLDLLAYKPGRRAVFRVNAALKHRRSGASLELPLHVKVERPSIYPESHDRLAAVHATRPPDATWDLPTPYGKVDRRWLTVSEWIEGSSLEAGVRAAGDVVPDARRAGAALASLHGSGPSVEAAPAPETALGVKRLAGDLARLLPAERSRILDLGSRLARAADTFFSRAATFAHGDFHLGQVIVTRDRVALVDFDRSGPGHPGLDVGSFRAHLAELEASSALDRAFVDGYTAIAGALDEREVHAGTAIGIFRRSVFPFRRLDPDWQHGIASSLRQTEDELERVER